MDTTLCTRGKRNKKLFPKIKIKYKTYNCSLQMHHLKVFGNLRYVDSLS